jgi:uncharacterized protein YbjT (DUF2867 family)
MNYLITGSTGNIGGRVVERLLEAGIRPRVLARDPKRAREAHGGRVDVTVGDLSDPVSLRAAFKGVSTLLLVNSGPDLAARDAAAARVARETGVRHLVKLSSLDVEQQVGTGVWHAQGELAIRESGPAFTFIRPSGFMSNALGWAHSINAHGVVRTSTGDGRIAMIDPDDIADVTTKALLSREYDGHTLPISGPEALTYAEMTAKLGAALGRPLVFQSMSDAEARERFLALDDSRAMVEAIVSIWRAIREGRLAGVTDTVRRVLGREPRTFDSWAHANVAEFGEGEEERSG